MKRINLAAYGVANASQNEVQAINGGIFGLLLLIGGELYLLNKYSQEVEDFTKGLFRGTNDGLQ